MSEPDLNPGLTDSPFSSPSASNLEPSNTQSRPGPCPPGGSQSGRGGRLCYQTGQLKTEVSSDGKALEAVGAQEGPLAKSQKWGVVREAFLEEESLKIRLEGWDGVN